MYALNKTVSANVHWVSLELDRTVFRLGAIDDRWLTSGAIEPGDIAAVYEIDSSHRVGGYPAVTYHINEDYRGDEPVISDGYISDGYFQMSHQPQTISNNYVRLARLEHGRRFVDAFEVIAPL